MSSPRIGLIISPATGLKVSLPPGSGKDDHGKCNGRGVNGEGLNANGDLLLLEGPYATGAAGMEIGWSTQARAFMAMMPFT